MSVTLRDAAERDLPGILEITNDAILHTTALWSLTPETLESRQTWLADRRAKGFPVLVAQLHGQVVGFGSLGDFRAWQGYAHSVEHSLYVGSDSRGRGIGRLLLTSLIERAMQMGKHAMIGGIEAANTASLALHASLGFREVGRLPEVGRKFNRWLDLVFMHRLLA